MNFTFDFENGQLLLIDKPKTWTSFDVVAKVRNTLKKTKMKVGHAGTLDPLATGLLLVCTGKKTKTIDSLTNENKEYIAEITLGATTPCYDAELPPENFKPTADLTLSQIEDALPAFQGKIMQTPPLYSAIWVDGKRAYEAARKGSDLKMQPRPVEIYELEILSFEETNRLTLRVACSKGAYIRSLAHDLGQVLGVGGYLSGLVRTRVGDFHLKDAYQLPDLVQNLQTVVAEHFTTETLKPENPTA